MQAAYFRANLRVVAAGGDGTVAWILGTIAELGLNPAPPVAVCLKHLTSSCGRNQGLTSANARLKTAVPHPLMYAHPQVLPLGTGNDLSLTFGWGNTFLPAWLRR